MRRRPREDVMGETGNYWVQSCGTCEEQFGCDLSDYARNTPPSAWVLIEQLGLNERRRRMFYDNIVQ